MLHTWLWILWCELEAFTWQSHIIHKKQRLDSETTTMEAFWTTHHQAVISWKFGSSLQFDTISPVPVSPALSCCPHDYWSASPHRGFWIPLHLATEPQPWESPSVDFAPGNIAPRILGHTNSSITIRLQSTEGKYKIILKIKSFNLLRSELFHSSILNFSLIFALIGTWWMYKQRITRFVCFLFFLTWFLCLRKMRSKYEDICFKFQ